MTLEYQARLRELAIWMNAAPDPEEQPTPKARELAGIERSNRLNRWRQFENAVSVETKWGPKRDVVAADHAAMLAAEAHFVATIASLEDTVPANQRERVRYENAAVREAHDALKVVRLGVEWIGSMEMVPPTLYDFLVRERGWTKRDGAFLRGSLASLEDRLAEMDGRLTPARKVIADEMARSLDEVPA
jgi:hypothetical protein